MEPMSMPCTQTQYFTAALFFTSAKSASLRSLSFSRPPRFRSLSFNSGTGNSQDDEDFLKDEEDSSHLTVVERYSSGSVKRYIWDGKGKQTFVEEHRAQINKLHDDSHLTRLPESIKDFIFPAGFPGSVSDDYLDYMIWQFPTNVTGWICNALVTSSLLKAVGVVSFSGSAVAASAAAIRWVSKDGIGAVGRLIIGLTYEES